MILAWDDERVGVVVDAVSEVLRVEADAIKPPPALVRGLAAEYITGLVALGEHTVIMLAARKLLSSTERLELDQRMAEAAHE